MRDIMRLAGSWLEEGLSKARPKRPITGACAKVGLKGAPGAQVIRNRVLKLDDYIVGNN